MKKIKDGKIKSLGGIILRVPDVDSLGNVELEAGGGVKTKDGSISDVLKLLVLRFPIDKITQKDTMHGARLYNQVLAAENGVLPIEDGEHDWVMEKFNKSDIGAHLFGMHLSAIVDAIKAGQVEAISKKPAEGPPPKGTSKEPE